MVGVLSSLITKTSLIYAVLVMQYFTFCLIVTRFLNPRVLKIQSRPARSELITRDIKQSMLSLLSISAFIAIANQLYVLGFGFRAPDSVPGTIASFLASMFLFDTWFYWGHRLVHMKPLYRLMHRFHHVVVTPTPWNTNSETFLDNCFMQSYFLFAHFLLPIAPAALVMHKIFDQFNGMLGHSGHEHANARLGTFPSPLVGVRYHDQHHEFFTYNYSNHFSIWDRLMGTIHPAYDAMFRGLQNK